MDGQVGVDCVLGEASVLHMNVDLLVHSEEEILKTPPNVADARILIIDDHEVSRQVLLEQIEAWGFRPRACDNAVGGLALLRSTATLGAPFDAVILDEDMPALSGAEAATAIRADAALADIPIVMLSAPGLPGGDKERPDLDIQARLAKPAKTSRLRKCLINAIAAHRANVDSDAHNRRGIGFDRKPKDVGEIDVLIVEDDDVTQIVYQRILNETDYSYKIASDGRDAVEIYKSHKPRIIILDAATLDMNGLDATCAIRALQSARGDRAPIIGVTAHAASGDKQRCLDAGMDDCLPKPIAPKRLVSKIDQWLQRAAEKTALAR